jgi:hypothetical protein
VAEKPGPDCCHDANSYRTALGLRQRAEEAQLEFWTDRIGIGVGAAVDGLFSASMQGAFIDTVLVFIFPGALLICLSVTIARRVSERWVCEVRRAYKALLCAIDGETQHPLPFPFPRETTIRGKESVLIGHFRGGYRPASDFPFYRDSDGVVWRVRNWRALPRVPVREPRPRDASAQARTTEWTADTALLALVIVLAGVFLIILILWANSGVPFEP